MNGEIVMKKAFFILLLLMVLVLWLWPVSGQAQQPPQPTAAPERRTVQVIVESLFLRALPLREAEASGSVFENDVLEAIGRNADGTWFQVSRPGRGQSLGWLPRQYVSFTFAVGELPLTDAVTGVPGPQAIRDVGVAALMLGEARLRDRPNGSNVIVIVPINVTIPVVGRSADNLWVEVNYLGQAGWIAEFLTRITGDLNSVPVSAGSVSGLGAGGLPIIPIELQLAQVQRFREYLIPVREQAAFMAFQWQTIRNGDTIPCNPPGQVGYYPYTSRDIVELPELRRYTRRMERAVDDLNASINAFSVCGVFPPETISEAYASAVNAGVILEAILESLENVEENIIPR